MLASAIALAAGSESRRGGRCVHSPAREREGEDGSEPVRDGSCIHLL